MGAYEHEGLRVEIDERVAFVTLDHPPVNLFDAVLIGSPGILPGGGGTQRLPRLMGRSRALEVVLGCDDYDAELAERYGWINRALPAADIGPFVDRLARRIAAFPPQAVLLAKRAVDAAGGPLEDGLLEEAHCFNLTLT